MSERLYPCPETAAVRHPVTGEPLALRCCLNAPHPTLLHCDARLLLADGTRIRLAGWSPRLERKRGPRARS